MGKFRRYRRRGKRVVRSVTPHLRPVRVCTRNVLAFRYWSELAELHKSSRDRMVNKVSVLRHELMAMGLLSWSLNTYQWHITAVGRRALETGEVPRG